MAGENDQSNTNRIEEEPSKPLEVSAEGIENALGRLTHLSLAVDEYRITAAGRGHPDITYGAELDADRCQKAIEVTVSILDLAIPRSEGSWADEVARHKAEFLQSSAERVAGQPETIIDGHVVPLTD